MNTRSHPSQFHQCTTDTLAHDGCVPQGFANGHIAIKGHEDKYQDPHAPKEVKYKDLGHALIVGDDFLLSRNPGFLYYVRFCHTSEF